MKTIIRKLFYLILLVSSIQHSIGQNNINFKGSIIEYDTKGYLPGVIIGAYKGNELINETSSDFDGLFILTTNIQCNKIVLSFPGFYPIIIKKISDIGIKELNLETIELYAIDDTCYRYISKKAEREHKRELKFEFEKLKKEIKISSGNLNYVMKLKKYKGGYAFFINFKEIYK